MKTLTILFFLITSSAQSQEIRKQITPTTEYIIAGKQLTIETPDRQLMVHLNSPRWFMTKTGLYRMSFKQKDSTTIINKIKEFYNIKEHTDGKQQNN